MILLGERTGDVETQHDTYVRWQSKFLRNREAVENTKKLDNLITRLENNQIKTDLSDKDKMMILKYQEKKSDLSMNLRIKVVKYLLKRIKKEDETKFNAQAENLEKLAGTIHDDISKWFKGSILLKLESNHNAYINNGLCLLSPKFNKLGWHKYPGFKKIKQSIQNLKDKSTKKDLCRKDIVELISSIIFINHCVTTLTVKHNRKEVRSVGKTLQCDLHSMLNRLDSIGTLHKIKNLARDNEVKRKVKHNLNIDSSITVDLMIPEIIDSKDLDFVWPDNIPSECCYVTIMNDICEASHLMQLAFGIHLHCNQEYIRRYWPKKKTERHCREGKDAILYSLSRFKNLIGNHPLIENTDPDAVSLHSMRIAKNIPIVDKFSPFYIAFARYIHNKFKLNHYNENFLDKHHRGVATNYHNSLEFLYAPGGESIFRRIANSCFQCIKKSKKLIEYEFGSLPLQSLTVLKPFTHVHIDLMGPYLVKTNLDARDTRARISNIKVWGLIFVCSFSRATHIEVTESCTVGGICDAFSRMQCTFGPINYVVSDKHASQIKVLKDAEFVEQINNTLYKRHGFFFQVVPVSKHQWNGIAEVRIRSAKNLIGKGENKVSNLTILQFSTLLKVTAALMNAIPLGSSLHNPGSDLYLKVISPQDFLIPKSGLSRTMISFVSVSDSNEQYFQHMGAIYDELITFYSEVVIPTVLLPPTRGDRRRLENLQDGDLILFKKRAANTFLPGYSLGRVDAIHLSNTGRPVSITVRYVNVKRKEKEDHKKDKDANLDDYEEAMPGRRFKLGGKIFNEQIHLTHRQSNECIKLFPLTEIGQDFNSDLRIVAQWCLQERENVRDPSSEKNSAEKKLYKCPSNNDNEIITIEEDEDSEEENEEVIAVSEELSSAQVLSVNQNELVCTSSQSHQSIELLLGEDNCHTCNISAMETKEVFPVKRAIHAKEGHQSPDKLKCCCCLLHHVFLRH